MLLQAFAAVKGTVLAVATCACLEALDLACAVAHSCKTTAVTCSPSRSYRSIFSDVTATTCVLTRTNHVSCVYAAVPESFLRLPQWLMRIHSANAWLRHRWLSQTG